MRANPPLQPEAFHAAFARHVASLYGWPSEKARLDPRLVFYLRLVANTGNLVAGKHLVDLGAGMSAFGPVARALGLVVTLIDDFGGGGGLETGPWQDGLNTMRHVCGALGVRLLELDFLRSPLPLESETVDVVTCFHSLEHWHHSPKRLFGEISRILRPGAFLILATPNAANLRRRVACLMGQNVGPELDDWYHHGDPVFRGHVRVPTVKDLKQICRWNGFEIVAVRGRNFIGRQSRSLGFLPKQVVFALGIVADVLLRPFPTLCSDIHVIAQKPARV